MDIVATDGAVVGNDWVQNALSFAVTSFENEGLLGLATGAVTQTTHIAVSVTTSVVDIILGAISPVLVGGGGKQNQSQFQYHGPKMIKYEAELYYDAEESCRESVFFDAQDTNSSTDNLSAASVASVTPTEGKCCAYEPVPKSVIVQSEDKNIEEEEYQESNGDSRDDASDDESGYADFLKLCQSPSMPEMETASDEDSAEVRESPAFYLDISNLVSEVDQSIIPCSLEDDSDDKFFGLCDSAESIESFDYVLDALVERSLKLNRSSSNDDKKLRWKPDKHTKDVLKCHCGYDSEDWSEILESKVLKWTSSHDNMLKTQGIVDITPSDLKDLLLDCNRGQLYNKNSISKESLRIYGVKVGEAKIVQHVMRIPIVGGSIDTLSLTHSRRIADGSYIIVSQAVSETQTSPKTSFFQASILRPVPNSDKTELTNITQSSSMPIPRFLVDKVASMVAIDFFTNLRAFCGEVGNAA